MLFTDEKRFRLYGNDGSARVYRRVGERFTRPCIIEREQQGGGSVMVWAGVSLHHKTDIVFVDGNLTAARYQEEILRPHVLPLTQEDRRL